MIDDDLSALLENRLGVAAQLRGQVTSVSGGFAATIYAFELHDPPAGWHGPLILRVMPNADLASKEIVVQRTMADSGFATPTVLLDGVDDALGAYMVMPRVEGESPLAGLSLATALRTIRSLLRDLPPLLAAVALDLHRHDPAPVLAACASAGIEPSRLTLEASLSLVRAGDDVGAIGLDTVLAWLVENRPAAGVEVTCHGDLHPFNLIVGADGAVTVLDWTNVTVARREQDVGFTKAFLACAPIAVPRPLVPLVNRLKAALASRFVNAYEASAPLDATVVAYFEALQYARCMGEWSVMRVNNPVRAASHPFHVAAPAMIAGLRRITGVEVSPPALR